MFVRSSGVVALVASIVVVAGCGGGGSSSGRELSKAEFVKEADSICSALVERAKPIQEGFNAIEESPDGGSPAKVAKVGALLKEVAAESEGAWAEIRALRPPQADAATIDAMLDKDETVSKVFLATIEALEDDDPTTYAERQSELESLNAQATKMAKAYGLKVCAQNPER